jgi:hypothetical protein
MKQHPYFITLFFFAYLNSFSQNGDFPFGKILHEELGMTTYAGDTSAAAVVLNEFGTAYFNDEVHIIFEKHLKIKILKKEGLKKGNFEVYLFKNGATFHDNERWVSLKASTFNYDGNNIKESVLDDKKVLIENTNANYNIVKIALENVKVGSVLEIKYITESPYYFNFKSWYFQSDIPKIRSEFWASLPGNFNYSISLNGFQKLTSQKSEVLRKCFLMPGAGSDGQRSAESDCSLSKYVMENVPALKEESYVSSMKNFTSSIHYELSEIIFPDGRKNTFSEEWKDVDYKLKEHEDFGQKIKKAKRILEDVIPGVIGSEGDALKKSTLIYSYINHWYSWSGDEDKYASQDAKKKL